MFALCRGFALTVAVPTPTPFTQALLSIVVTEVFDDLNSRSYVVVKVASAGVNEMSLPLPTSR